MQIYHYDRSTGEYLGNSVADRNPVTADNYLIPAFATEIAPPSANEKEAAVFDQQSGEWHVVPDHRGTYWQADGTPVHIATLAEAPDPAWLNAPPPPPEPTPEDIRRAIGREIDRYLDTVAQAWDYRSIISAVSYLGDPDPVFAAEAQALMNWRSQVFVRVRQIEGEVNQGARQVPTAEELLSELPPPPQRPSS